MDLDTLWNHVHTERRALAELLTGLGDDQWQHPSNCDGWRVLDVAAHVISHPQIGWHDAPAMFGRNLGRGYNGMIKREVQRLGRRNTPASVLADFATYDGSRRHAPLTAPSDALLDVLAHTQDILKPLGLAHTAPGEAYAAGLDRAIQRARLVGWRGHRGRRLVATDLDWSHGEGPVTEGTAYELFLLATGRAHLISVGR